MDEVAKLKHRIRELEAELIRSQAELNNAAMALQDLTGKMIRQAAEAGKAVDASSTSLSNSLSNSEKNLQSQMAHQRPLTAEEEKQALNYYGYGLKRI
jgi:predicted  nucleic acid-binding Zn-ribbon protein